MKIKEIIDYAEKQGFKVSERKIYLWSKNIPLPEPGLKNEGRGKGLNKDYPIGTENMAVEICRLQEKGLKTYDEITWALFLLQYPIPGYRLREIMEHAFQRILLEDVFTFKVNSKIDYIILGLSKLICENDKYKQNAKTFLEYINDMFTCSLGTGNSISISTKNPPESLAIINEERNSEEVKEFVQMINEIFKECKKQSPEHPLLNKNFKIPAGFNMKPILKLFFAYRFQHIVNAIVNVYIKFDIKSVINKVTEAEINQFQTGIIPGNDSIENMLVAVEQIINPYNPICSLLIPIMVEVSNNKEISELGDWAFYETSIQEEPWYKNHPYKVIAQLLYSLRHSNSDIEKSREG